MACDPIRAEGLKNIELGLARDCGAAIGQVDDLALLGAVYRRMRLFDKALQPLRKPMMRRACRRSPLIPCCTTTQRPSSVTMKPCRYRSNPSCTEALST